MAGIDPEKTNLQVRYRSLIDEAASIAPATPFDEFLVARTILKAEAIAMKHFRQFGDLVAPNAFPGAGADEDERDHVSKLSDTPAKSLSDPQDALYEFLVDRHPSHCAQWSAFLRDGTIANALEWQRGAGK